MRHRCQPVLFLALLFVLSGCGLGTVQNLHFLDRIPHQPEKGYVVFSADSRAEPGTEHLLAWLQEHGGVITFQVYLKEFNHKVPLTALSGLAALKTTPVTIYPGNHVLMIEFPVALGFPGMDREVQARVLGKETLLTVFNRSKEQGSAFIKTGAVEIPIVIQKDHTTHIRLKSVFSLYENRDASHGPYLTGIEFGQAAPELTPLTGFEILEGAQGPKRYKADYATLYDKVRLAVSTLKWEIEKADKAQGMILAVIKRFPAEPFFFTIGVNDLGNDQIQVDISADNGWQRWGTINTGMSLEKINEFYRTLDSLI